MSRAVQLVLLSVVILTCLQTGVAQDKIAADDHVDNAVLKALLAKTEQNLRRDLTSLINEKMTSLVSELHTSLDLVTADVKKILKSQLKLQTEAQLAALKFHMTSELAGLYTSLQSDTREQLTQLREKLRDDTSSLKGNLSSLNDSMNRISDNVEAHDNHVTTELMELDQNLQQNFTLQLKNSYGYAFTPTLYTCGGTGGWRRVVYLDFTDTNTPCPSGWDLTSRSKRTCGKLIGPEGCKSVTFPVTGRHYTRVCGRIIAYQDWATDAFESYHTGRVTTIDGAYVDGVSLTHGSPRQHIWTFAAGFSEFQDRNRKYVCPCDATTNINIPPFVGEDYFCESGHNSGSFNSVFEFHPNDPLWDGGGCRASSTCCTFNNPPYFTKQLPSPTTDDIEARICHSFFSEDSPIEFIELYVQ